MQKFFSLVCHKYYISQVYKRIKEFNEKEKNAKIYFRMGAQLLKEFNLRKVDLL